MVKKKEQENKKPPYKLRRRKTKKGNGKKWSFCFGKRWEEKSLSGFHFAVVRGVLENRSNQKRLISLIFVLGFVNWCENGGHLI